MSERNPWGLTQKQVKVMDLTVQLGDQYAVAKHLGMEQRAVSALRDRACENIGLPFVHAVIAWREHRKLVPDLKVPTKANPFGLTDQQRAVWELRIQGLSYRQIAERTGVLETTVGSILSRARNLIPGEREGQKQAAWRRACTPGD